MEKSFQPETLIKSIQSLTDSQTSINNITNYMLLHRENHPTILEIFLREFENSNDCHRVYLLFILCELFRHRNANDPSVRALTSDFLHYIPYFFSCMSDCDIEWVRSKINIIRDIWIKNQIIPEKIAEKLEPKPETNVTETPNPFKLDSNQQRHSESSDFISDKSISSQAVLSKKENVHPKLIVKSDLKLEKNTPSSRKVNNTKDNLRLSKSKKTYQPSDFEKSNMLITLTRLYDDVDAFEDFCLALVKYRRTKHL